MTIPAKIEISHKTIIFIAVFIAALWFVWQILDILLMMFIAFILMSALRPAVDWLHDRKIPRMIAIGLVFGTFLVVFGGVLVGTLPSLIIQSARLIQQLPHISAGAWTALNIDVSMVSQQIAPISENIIKMTVSIFSNLIATLTVLVFTFYFLLERKKTESILAGFIGPEKSELIIDTVKRVEYRLGAWVIGELILMVVIGLLCYIGLTILHVEYALPLAIIAGILEIVPTIGPIVAAIPAMLVALTISPLFALSVAALYFIIQQLENSLVVPLVMKRSVGLSPLITIVSLMIGGRIAGVAGAVLAVPILLVIQEVAVSLTGKHNE